MEVNIKLICLIIDDVFRGKNSIVFNQTENRIHSIKSIIILQQNKIKE